MTEKADYLQFDTACWARVEAALDANPLIQDSDSTGWSIYANTEKNVGVLGRRHRGDKDVFWFNVEDQRCQHLSRYATSYVAFGCGEGVDPPIVLVEREHLETFFDRVSLTQRPKSVQHNITLTRSGTGWAIKLLGGEQVPLQTREI